VDERHHALGTSPGCAVDQLDALACEAVERRRQIVDDVADVMERRLGMLGDEPRDPRLAIGRLDQLDPPLRVAEKYSANALIGKLANAIRGKAERVAKEWKRSFDARNRDRDVMQRAELHSRGGT